MARARKILVFCLLLIASTAALELPDYIKPCSRNDPQFNDCALRNGREALPRIIRGDLKYGVPVLDPMFVEKFEVTQSGIQGSITNNTIVGLKDAELEAISVDFDRQVIKLSFKFPLITLSGWYVVKGKIMGMPMYGQGDYQVTFIKPHGNYSTNYTLTQSADGEQYVEPKDYDVEYDMQQTTFNVGNLFNGNKLLGNAINNLLNTHWRIVFEDLGKPIFKTFGRAAHQILKNVSQKVPYNELFTK